MPNGTEGGGGRRASDRGRYGRLTRERVLASALEIVDRDGLSGLSMRKLGAELGVEAMALYRYASGKDALLDGLVEGFCLELEAELATGRRRTGGERGNPPATDGPAAPGRPGDVPGADGPTNSAGPGKEPPTLGTVAPEAPDEGPFPGGPDVSHPADGGGPSGASLPADEGGPLDRSGPADGRGPSDASGPAGDGWVRELHRIALAAHRVAMRHPHVVPLLATRLLSTPLARRPAAVLRSDERVLALLHDAGFDEERTVALHRAFTAWLLGYLLVELRAMDDDPAEPDPAFRLGLHRISARELPRLRAVAVVLAERGGPSGLAAGLDALLDRFR